MVGGQSTLNFLQMMDCNLSFSLTAFIVVEFNHRSPVFRHVKQDVIRVIWVPLAEQLAQRV